MQKEDDSESGGRPPPVELSALGEDGLIRRIRKAVGPDRERLIRGVGDDAAVAATAEKSLFTTDLMIEGVHFLLERTPPRLLGRKALAVNLSDIAAMAGTPKFALLSLGAPPGFSAAAMDQILAGFLERAEETGVALVGGDVCRAERLLISVCVIGEVEPPGPVYRSGAAADDLLFVTGELGDAGLGLKRLLDLAPPVTEELIAGDPLAGPLRRHLDPDPRLGEGRRLAGKATAMMDLSDGLLADLPRLLLESKVPGAEIELERVPLSAQFQKHFQVKDRLAGEALQTALGGGEDYELLFTAPAGLESELLTLGAQGVSIARIGRLSGEPGLRLLDRDGAAVDCPAPAFEHFAVPGRNRGAGS